MSETLQKPKRLYEATLARDKVNNIIKYIISHDLTPSNWEIMNKSGTTYRLDKFRKEMQELLEDGYRGKAASQLLTFLEVLEPKMFEVKERVKTNFQELLKIIEVQDGYIEDLERLNEDLQKEGSENILQKVQQKIDSFEDIIMFMVSRLEEFLKMNKALEEKGFKDASQTLVREMQKMITLVQIKAENKLELPKLTDQEEKLDGLKKEVDGLPMFQKQTAKAGGDDE